jgi:tetratricopeptide (TPR) repeat protein
MRAADRSLFLGLYFDVGRRLVEAGDTKHGQRLDAYARKVLRDEGAFGPAVHWLVDRLEAAAGGFTADPAAPPAEEARALVQQHLAFAAQGRDRNVPFLVRSLERVEALDDIADALQRTDELLRRDPTLIALWRHRALLQERRGDVDAALASLRWISTYVPDQGALLELARIAGSHGRVAAADRELLDRELTEATRQTPHAKFALGLLELRQGELEKADALLRECAPRPDGGHLFFLALTNVVRGDGLPAAAAAFRKLADEHPGSPHGTPATPATSPRSSPCWPPDKAPRRRADRAGYFAGGHPGTAGIAGISSAISPNAVPKLRDRANTRSLNPPSGSCSAASRPCSRSRPRARSESSGSSSMARAA